MKRPLSRAEWLLITLPLVCFGIFAALYVRWKATAPAVLNASPIPLFTVWPTYDGQSIMALGVQTNALNVQQPGAPWHFLRWNTKNGSLNSNFAENRNFSHWAFSLDGQLFAFYAPGAFNRATFTHGPGTIVVRRTEDGSEISSWSHPSATPLSFSPDSRELITVGTRLERYDISMGKLLGFAATSRVFPSNPYVSRMNFSPDGRFVALIEQKRYASTGTPPRQGAVTSLFGPSGGRIAVLSYPSFQPLLYAKGNLYTDCSWQSNSQLWAVATLRTGHKIQKYVRAQIDVPSKQTSIDALELPTNINAWNENSLSISGVTGQVLVAGPSRIIVWGRNGQIATTFTFPELTAPKGGRLPLGASSPPRFSPDGRTVYRVNGTDVERYDLSRFLPDPAPVQTSGQ